MTPTAKAVELLEPLRLALDQVRATVAVHRNFDPVKAKLIVTIACTDYLHTAVIKPLALWLRTKAPGVRVAEYGRSRSSVDWIERNGASVRLRVVLCQDIRCALVHGPVRISTISSVASCASTFRASPSE